jgi:iron complex outermembrane receptor protein
MMLRPSRLQLAVAAALAQFALGSPIVLAADPVDLGAVGTGAGNATAQTEAASGRTPALPAAAVNAPAAAAAAVSQGNLEARWPTSEINENYIRNYTAPNSDYTQILNVAPSIIAPPHPNGIGGGDSKIQFRGFGDGSFNMTWDGVPFNDSNDPTHHSWAYFPGQFIGGVVLDRSPGAASTFGPASFGGTVGLQSKDPTQRAGISPYASWGSFNTQLYGAEFNSGRFGESGSTAMLLDVQNFSSGGALTYDDQHRKSVMFKLQHAISADTSLTLFGTLNQMNNHTGNTTTGTRAAQALYGNNYLNSNDPTKTNYWGYNTYDVRTDMEYLQLTSNLGQGWTVDNKLFTYSYNNIQNYANTLFTAANGLPDGAAYGKSGTAAYPTGACIGVAPTSTCYNGIQKLNSYRTWGDILRFTKDTDWGQTRVGTWLTSTQTWRHGFYANVQDYGNVTQGFTGTSYHQDFTSNQSQTYIEHEFHPLDNVAITPGLKRSVFTQSINDAPAQNTSLTAPFSFSETYANTLPSLDVRWKVRPNWTVYAQDTWGVVIPSTGWYDVKLQQAVGNVVVPSQAKAQRDRAYQIGSVWKTDRYTVDVDAYMIKFDNMYSLGGYDATTNTFPVVNNGKVVYKGLEAEMTYVFGGGFSGYVNATLNSAKRTSDYTAISPSSTTGIPGNTEALGLFWESSAWKVGAIGKRIGSQYITTGGTPQGASINPYYITNAFVNYKLSNLSPSLKSIQLRVGVNNLFNKEDVTGLSQANTVQAPNDLVYRLPRRNGFIGINADF